MQKGRIITIAMEIVEPEKSEAVWDAMKSGFVPGQPEVLLAGCRVFAISNDDQISECGKYRELVEHAMRNAQDEYYTDPESVETECGKVFHWHPLGVYSTHEKYYYSGEWFPSLDSLKEKYKVKNADQQG